MSWRFQNADFYRTLITPRKHQGWLILGANARIIRALDGAEKSCQENRTRLRRRGERKEESKEDADSDSPYRAPLSRARNS